MVQTPFQMPTFDRTNTADENYCQLLLAPGLLGDVGSEVTVEGAEEILRQRMRAFLVDGTQFLVDDNPDQTALRRLQTPLFMYAVSKAEGHHRFKVHHERRLAFCSYVSETVLWTALEHPGTYPILMQILAGGVEIEVVCPVYAI